MTFLTPALLWALPVALIPLIIYLLMRFRTLRVDWGADYVLLKALERMRKRLFLDQIILILLRTLALVALVLAFARPVSESADAVASGTGIHRVVVVDCSYSMTATAGEESRWEQVHAVVEELAGSWGRNERWSLYAIDDQPGWRVRDAAIASSEEVLAALDTLEPMETDAAVGRALDEVLQTAVTGPTEIYLVTDDQATTWEDARNLSVPQREDLRVFWIRPGATVQDNLAVTGVVPGSDRVLAGHPLRVFVSVRNFGRDPQLEVPVELLIDGRFAGRESISLQPGQELEAEVDLRFERAGSHVVSARIGDDALAFDNEAATGIMVERALEVAVLRDPDRDDLFESSYPFLELAARVLEERSESGLAPFTVGLVDGNVDAAGLAGFDCVVLDGGRSLDLQLAAELEAYVERGGALVLAASDQVDAAAWNRELGALGLLPARLGALQVVPLGAEGAAIPRRGGRHPAFRNFETTEDGDLGRLRFHTWFELVEPAEDAEAVLRFGDGGPFVLMRDHGRGSVTLLAAGLDGRNANLVARELFHPFLVRLLSAAVTAARDPLRVSTGETIELRVPPTGDLRGATFDLEGEEPIPARIEEADDHIALTLPGGSARSGAGSFLLVTGSGTERIHVGVQGPRLDSDLRALADAEREQLVDRLQLEPVTTWEELSELLRTTRQGAERYAWVLVAMLLFLFGELFVARRFVG